MSKRKFEEFLQCKQQNDIACERVQHKYTDLNGDNGKEICRNFLRGRCTRLRCRFFHSPIEDAECCNKHVRMLPYNSRSKSQFELRRAESKFYELDPSKLSTNYHKGPEINYSLTTSERPKYFGAEDGDHSWMFKRHYTPRKQFEDFHQRFSCDANDAPVLPAQNRSTVPRFNGNVRHDLLELRYLYLSQRNDAGFKAHRMNVGDELFIDKPVMPMSMRTLKSFDQRFLNLLKKDRDYPGRLI